MNARPAEDEFFPFELSPRQLRRADELLVPNTMLINLLGLYGPQTLNQIKKRLPLMNWTRPQIDGLRVQLGVLRRDVQAAWGTGYVIMTNMKTAKGRSETHYKLTPGARRQWLDITMPGLEISDQEKTRLRAGEGMA